MSAQTRLRIALDLEAQTLEGDRARAVQMASGAASSAVRSRIDEHASLHAAEPPRRSPRPVEVASYGAMTFAVLAATVLLVGSVDWELRLLLSAALAAVAAVAGCGAASVSVLGGGVDEGSPISLAAAGLLVGATVAVVVVGGPDTAIRVLATCAVVLALAAVAHAATQRPRRRRERRVLRARAMGYETLDRILVPIVSHAMQGVRIGPTGSMPDAWRRAVSQMRSPSLEALCVRHGIGTVTVWSAATAELGLMRGSRDLDGDDRPDGDGP